MLNLTHGMNPGQLYCFIAETSLVRGFLWLSRKNHFDIKSMSDL